MKPTGAASLPTPSDPHRQSYTLPVVSVSRFGLAVRRQAGKRKDLDSIPFRLSFLFKKVVACGHYLVTLSLIINETFKWLSSLPILMQELFWW